MNFFEAQDRARSNSRTLIFWFALSTTILSMIFYLGCHFLVFNQPFRGIKSLFDDLFYSEVSAANLIITSILILTIIFSTVYKSWQLSRGGGKAIATLLGGKLLEDNESSSDCKNFSLKKKMLENINQEMALAASIPAPNLYLLENEEINAFAAGHRIENSVIGVTTGCLEKLSRDELQGVIAHEYSHILNGDGKINLRLSGVMHGLFIIGYIGLRLMSSRSNRSKKKEGKSSIAFLGLLAFLLGSLGYLLGAICRSKVSKQREFLADASAVQFTRNPDGICGALDAIKHSSSSFEEIPKGGEYSHVFFSPPSSSFQFLRHSTMLDTHPPLTDRIHRINPTFHKRLVEKSIQFIRIFTMFDTHPPFTDRIHRINPTFQTKRLVEKSIDQTSNVPAISANNLYAVSARNTLFVDVVDATTMGKLSARNVGKISSKNVEDASSFLQNLPVKTKTFIDDHKSASYILLSILLSMDTRIYKAQMLIVDSYTKADNFPIFSTIREHFLYSEFEDKLNIINLIIPNLRKLRTAEKQHLYSVVKKLALADDNISIFEISTLAILKSAFSDSDARSLTLNKSEKDKAIFRLIDFVSKIGASETADYISSRDAGLRKAQSVKIISNSFKASPHEDKYDSTRMLDSIEKVSSFSFKVKSDILDLILYIVNFDHKISQNEKNLIRGLFEALGCPHPLLSHPDAK